MKKQPKKKFKNFEEKVTDIPYLIKLQLNSYEWFFDQGLKQVFEEASPIEDHSGDKLELSFIDYHLEEPKYSEIEAQKHNASYEAPLRARVSLKNKKTEEIKEQEIYLGDFPLITDRGTFILNGVERVIVSQLLRSPGVYFEGTERGDQRTFGAQLIPGRGAWVEFETSHKGIIQAKVDRKRKFPATALLKAFSELNPESELSAKNDKEIRDLFSDLSGEQIEYIEETLKKDEAEDSEEGLVETYKRVRPGELATLDNARGLLEDMFSFERYDLSSVGRWKLQEKLRGERPEKTEFEADERLLNLEDLVLVMKEITRLNEDAEAEEDDIDHLKNRRLRPLGELLQDRVRIGMGRVERSVKDKMSTMDTHSITPSQVINPRPMMSVVRDFFMTGSLSQFMDQVNPLAELEHKRRISAMGPGGLTRERAGFDVRDVHPSHYGRICPIQTPEGQNIGLVVHLATYARVNELGFLETPYRKVEGTEATDEIEYLDAKEEENFAVAHAGEPLDEDNKLENDKVEARIEGEPGVIGKEEVDYMDVSPSQCISVATSLIPFLEKDDANRALMGSNMQRQAVSCVKPEAPLVGTGMEEKVAQDSGTAEAAQNPGVVKEVDAEHIVIETESGEEDEYQLRSFRKSNQYTMMHQHPRVEKGEAVEEGELISDGASIDDGTLALGQNLRVGFVPWEGSNFEDAVVISEKVVREDRFTSVHVEDYSCDVRDTKLGEEVTTPDIPNVAEEKLKDLDEKGIVRIGAEVEEGDILVGKITPKGETDLSAEESLLRSIFGEKARDVKDSSKRLPHGEKGRIVDTRILSSEKGDDLPSGVLESIQVDVADLKKIQAGDKLVGRHGNKGVIAKILPEEDMPFTADGKPLEIALNPLGVASRMNIGQIYETHMGLCAKELGYRAVTPALAGIEEEEVEEELQKAGFPKNGKVNLYDGRTGEKFSEKATVGYMYILKLEHMVEDKLHMRSIGPYSLITQQPLGGKSQFGGQRFGEMEVWALEAHGAAHTLQEMLTIKSDDVMGRAEAYESIIRDEDIDKPNLPASFKVLMREIRGLGLSLDLLQDEEE